MFVLPKLFTLFIDKTIFFTTLAATYTEINSLNEAIGNADALPTYDEQDPTKPPTFGSYI